MNQAIAGMLILVALAPAGPVFAAAQGSLGATSRGSIMISITIRAPNRVSGLSDIAFDGASAMATRTVCLSGEVHTYTVAASGSGPAGALTLSNGVDSIDYRVEWQPGAGRPADLPAGDAPVLLRSVADPAHCAVAAGVGRLSIALDSVAAERLRGEAPYAGALMLTLAPE